MSEQATIRLIKSSAKDLWDLISEVETPERWNIFFDSRTLSSMNLPTGKYFPSEFAFILQDLLSYDVMKVDPQEKKMHFRMASGFFDFSVYIQVIAIDIHSHLSVTTKSNTADGNIPEMKEILNYISDSLADNINLVTSVLFPNTSSIKTVNDDITSLVDPQKKLNSKEIKRISYKDDFDSVINGKEPVVFHDYAKFIKDFELLNDFEWWKKTFGEQSVKFLNFPSIAYKNDQSIGLTTINTLFDMMMKNPNQRKFATYEYPAFEIIGLFDYLKPASVIITDYPITKQNIWIGSKGVKSPLHQDRRFKDSTGYAPVKFHNLNFQISGSKKVVLAHPNQSPFLYPESHSINERKVPTSLVDVFDSINFNKYPELSKAMFYETTLRAGEMLYIPRGWWHAFCAESNSINYNTFFSSSSV